MLRTATKSASFGRTLQQTVRCQASQASTSKGGGIRKKVVIVTGIGVAASASIIGYACVDPVFRVKIEDNVPGSKQIFDYIINSKGFKMAKHNVEEASKAVSEKLYFPKKKITTEEPLLKIPDLPPPVQLRSEKVDVESVDVRADLTSTPPPQPHDLAERLKKNEALEASLKAAITSASEKVQTASNSKIKTIAAINEHARLLKATVDDPQNADWNKVTAAMEQVEKLSKEDASDEYNSRNYLDNIRKIVSDGRRDSATSSNPLLTNATESANKLGSQLDELNNLVQKSRNESRVLNQYKDLIEKSRKQFSMELKSILPNIDIHAKDAKLTEDELNALIAHAHLRVDELRRQLTEQQIREEQNIANAIEQQRRADSQLAEEQLELEMKRIREQSDVDLERKTIEARQAWEAELEERLRRAAAAHSEHLEQVVRTQRQLYDIEQTQKIEEAVAKERKLHSRQISIAQGKLDGIEAALNSRVSADMEIRRSKQFWIACQNLVESVVHGRKGGKDMESRRKPLATELKVIKEASCDDEFVTSLLDAVPNESIYVGVCTEEDLKTRFYNLYKTARRVAKIDDNGGGIMRYVSSFIQNAITLDLPRKYSLDDKFDPSTLDTYEILSRTRYYVESNDLHSAVRMAQLLTGEARQLAKDWISDTRTHLETRLIAELLVAHATVTSIRAVY